MGNEAASWRAVTGQFNEVIWAMRQPVGLAVTGQFKEVIWAMRQPVGEQ